MSGFENVKKAVFRLFFAHGKDVEMKRISEDRPTSAECCGILIGKAAEITSWTIRAIEAANDNCNESHRATALEALYAGILSSAMLIADELPPQNLDAVIRALEPAKTPEDAIIC